MTKVKLLKSLPAITIATIALNSHAHTETSILAVGPRVGLQGFGIEARTPITESIFARANANYFTYRHKLNDGNINYKGKLTLLTVPVMIDWHPIENSGFRISVGAAYNGNQLEIKGTTNQNVTLNGTTYTPAQIGHVKGKLKLGSRVAGVASLGYDGSFIDNGPFSFNLEAGIIYAGSPKLSVTAKDSILSTLPALQAKVEQDIKKDAEKSIKKIKKYLNVFPILSIGFKYAI